jgi:hypothetical protein
MVDMNEHLRKHRGESSNGELGATGQRTDLEGQETADKRVPKFQAAMRARRMRR